MIQQLDLQIAEEPLGARCGYCDRRLTRQSDGSWRCEPCQPGLAGIRNVDDWKTFARRAATWGGRW